MDLRSNPTSKTKKDADLKRQKNAEKVKRWREKQKLDAVKDEEIKKKDRERKKKTRDRLKQEAEKSKSKLEKLRKQKREEIQRYRQKHNNNKEKINENNETYDRTKTPESANKQLAVKRTQAWRMRIKLNKQSKVGLQNENEEQEEQVLNPSTSSSFRSRYARCRQMKKTRLTLPKTPSKRAEVVKQLVQSPTTSKILKNEGLILTPNCKRKLDIADDVISSLQENITEAKQANSSKSDKKHAYNILRATIEKRTRNKCGVYVRKLLSFSHRSKVTAKRQWWKKQERKYRKDKLCENIRLVVKRHYLSAEVSREVPNKKEIIKVKTPDGKKEVLQKHLMTMTLEDAFKNFKSVYPNFKIGFTMFKKLKPENVRKISETNRKSCLCQICCNFALKVDALKKHIKTIETPENKEHLSKIPLEKEKISSATVCEFENTPKAPCLERICQMCSTETLEEYFKELTDESKDKYISWHQWGLIEINKENKVKRCVSCIPKENNVKSFLVELKKDLEVYPGHIFRARWQQKQMTNCIDHLKHGAIAMVMDFSENYGCLFQSEVQSGFFDRNQVTIHPMMLYYKVKQEDGTREALVKHAIVGISEDNKHDADAVLEFEKQALDIVSRDTGIQIKAIHQWTDGCAAQYKGKKSFADISLRSQPSVCRNFFETSHGKNVCDGLGAIVKNSCYRAVISSKKIIGTAKDVFDHCEDRLTSVKAQTEGKENIVCKREFILVKGIKRDRSETNVSTLKGTRKLHAVRSTGHEYKLKTRKLSCYCLNCLEGNDLCENTNYCHNWEEQSLKLLNTTPNQSTEQDNMEQSDMEVNQQENIDSNKEDSIETDLAHPKKDLFQPGAFVAVLFPAKSVTVYIGQILDIDDKEVQLNYMKKSGKTYIWPDKQDTSWEDDDKVIASLSEPTMSDNRSHFAFDPEELNDISQKLLKDYKYVYFR